MARSNQEKSLLVSGAGLLTGIFSALEKEVKAIGGTDGDLHRLVTPEGEETIKAMARLIAGVRTITVDYDRGIEHSYQAGRYDEVNSRISTVNFANPTSTNLNGSASGIADVEMTLVHLDKEVDIDQVHDYMLENGLRPANIKELMALGESEPDLPGDFRIVALGSSLLVEGTRYVPLIMRFGRQRNLWMSSEFLGFDEGDYWSPGTRFLAVNI